MVRSGPHVILLSLKLIAHEPAILIIPNFRDQHNPKNYLSSHLLSQHTQRCITNILLKLSVLGEQACMCSNSLVNFYYSNPTKWQVFFFFNALLFLNYKMHTSKKFKLKRRKEVKQPLIPASPNTAEHHSRHDWCTPQKGRPRECLGPVTKETSVE